MRNIALRCRQLLGDEPGQRFRIAASRRGVRAHDGPQLVKCAVFLFVGLSQQARGELARPGQLAAGRVQQGD